MGRPVSEPGPRIFVMRLQYCADSEHAGHAYRKKVVCKLEAERIEIEAAASEMVRLAAVC